ncbi:MAG: hypothetical protein PHF33_07140 [Candidatus Delongbacteria bacterium]|nr:hypothetical protein [Candidatus Delongbacteria bacterium]
MEKDPVRGKLISVPTKTILYLSVIVFLFGAALVLVGFTDFDKPESFLQLVSFAVMVILFFTLGLLLFLFYIKSKIEADSFSVRSYGITGKFKEIKWGEINKIEFPKSYGKENGIVKISDKSKTIALTGLYSRHYNIIELLAEKLDPELHKDAIGKINNLANKHR